MRTSLIITAVMAITSVRVRAAPTARLDVIGNACPDQSIERRVAALMGRDPFVDEPTSSIIVTIERARDAIAAHIQLGDDRREVEAPSCDELGDAVAIVVALALRDETTTPNTQPPAPAEHLTSRTAIYARAKVPSTNALEVGAASSIGVSTAGVRTQLAIGGALRRGSGSFGLEAQLGLPDTISLGNMASVAIDSAAIAIAPCLRARGFALCSLVIAGLVHGSGEHLLDANAVWSPQLALGARIVWRHALVGATELQARVDIDGAITRTQFVVDDRVVWSTPRIEALAGVGVLAHFP
jgi:hypothetical protein